MNITVHVEPSDGAPAQVEYRWDTDTAILTASLADGGPREGTSGAVELAGNDGSWVTLELRAGRFCGIEVAVWPPVKARSVLAPPSATEPAHAVLPQATVAGTGLADLEVDTLLSAESDRMERTFHLRVGPPRRARAVRVGRDILMELDDADQLAGLWLLNVPPVPLPS